MSPHPTELDPDAVERSRRDAERRRRATDHVAIWVAVWLLTQFCAVVTLCAGMGHRGRVDPIPIVTFWCLAIAAAGVSALCTIWYWSSLSRRCVTAGLAPWGLLLLFGTAAFALALFA